MDMDCRPDSSAGQMQSQTYTPPARDFLGRNHHTYLARPQAIGFHPQSQAGTLSLPVEILTEIFLCCLDASEYITPSRRDAPLLLCQICRHWREVALSTPLLWSSLEVYERPPMPSLVQCWLERSQPYPVSLSIFPAAPMCGWKTKDIFDHFLENVSRWKKVNLGSMKVLRFGFLSWIYLAQLCWRAWSCRFLHPKLNVPVKF
ncbi:hypothetical protein BD779DRAFT_935519 [Infundibulicybe gibba]|nr:hypothetical protein BD779DRAFT_935519 [Infundibulicybe gibba]